MVCFYRQHAVKQFWSADSGNVDPTMRISRKSASGLKVGEFFKIYSNDFFNPADLEGLDQPDGSTINPLVQTVNLGFMQIKLPWIYLVSEKQAPDSPSQPCKRLKGG